VSTRLDRIEALVEQNIQTIERNSQVIALCTKKSYQTADTSIEAYQRSTKRLVRLGFVLLVLANLTTIVTAVLR
jgi:DNA-binding transcriptional regulator YbjK